MEVSAFKCHQLWTAQAFLQRNEFLQTWNCWAFEISSLHQIWTNEAFSSNQYCTSDEIKSSLNWVKSGKKEEEMLVCICVCVRWIGPFAFVGPLQCIGRQSCCDPNNLVTCRHHLPDSVQAVETTKLSWEREIHCVELHGRVWYSMVALVLYNRMIFGSFAKSSANWITMCNWSLWGIMHLGNIAADIS